MFVCTTWRVVRAATGDPVDDEEVVTLVRADRGGAPGGCGRREPAGDRPAAVRGQRPQGGRAEEDRLGLVGRVAGARDAHRLIARVALSVEVQRGRRGGGNGGGEHDQRRAGQACWETDHARTVAKPGALGAGLVETL